MVLPSTGPISFSNLNTEFSTVGQRVEFGTAGPLFFGTLPQPVSLATFRGLSYNPIRLVSPLGSVTLSNNARTYPLSNTFSLQSVPPGNALSYAITSSPNSNASLSSNVMSVQGAFRNGAYGVTVLATDLFGHSLSNVLSVTELAPSLIATTLGSVTVSNNLATYALSNYFTSGTPLTYAVTTNPRSNAAIVGPNSNLTVQGAWRNAGYNVVVTATDTTNATATSTLAVTESRFPLGASSFGSVTLGNNTVNYFVPNYFTTFSTGYSLTYAIISNPLSNATIDVGCNLSVVGAYRKNIYSIVVRATDNFGYSNTSTLAVTESNSVVAVTAQSTLSLAADTRYVGLSNVFSGVTSLTYGLSSNPYNNASLNTGVVSIVGDYRSTSYNVWVRATDGYATTATTNLPVTESHYALGSTPLGGPFTLSNDSKIVSIASYFPTWTSYTKTYYLASSPRSNATLVGDTLTVTGNYRSTTSPYSVVVGAIDNYGYSNTSTMTVSEIHFPLTATNYGSVSLSNDLGVYAMAPRFNTWTSGYTLDYAFSNTGNPIGSAATLNSSTGVLYVQGDYRSTAYNVVVRATDNFGYSNFSAVTVTEAHYPLTSSNYGSVSLSNDVGTYAMAPRFYTWPRGYTLSYSVAANPRGNATVVSSTGVLTVTGFYRNSSYNVVVTATDNFGYTANSTVAVTETQSVVTKTGDVSRTVGGNYFTYDLTTIFSGSSSLTYSASTPTNGYNWNITGSTLNVYANYRNVSYNIDVFATDIYGTVCAWYLSITEVARPAAIGGSTSLMLINTTPVNYNALTFFTLPGGMSVALSLVSNPQNSATVSGSTVTITGAFRSLAYAVTVRATDITYGGNGFAEYTINVADLNTNNIAGLSSGWRYFIYYNRTGSGTGSSDFSSVNSFPPNLTTFVGANTVYNPFGASSGVTTALGSMNASTGNSLQNNSGNNFNSIVVVWAGFAKITGTSGTFTISFVVGVNTAKQYVSFDNGATYQDCTSNNQATLTFSSADFYYPYYPVKVVFVHPGGGLDWYMNPSSVTLNYRAGSPFSTDPSRLLPYVTV